MKTVQFNRKLLLSILAVVCSCMILTPHALFAAASDLDTGFDSDGKVITDFSGTNDLCRGIVLLPDGKIVAAGRTIDATTNTDFALVRYNTDGSLDPLFGNAGKVTTDFNLTDDEAYAIARQSDGKLVVVGSTFGGATYDFAVVRYTEDGDLDSSFGTGGRVITDFAGDADDARAVAIQSDGKIVVAGNTYHTGNAEGDFSLARYNSDGSLDNSFGFGGKVTTDIPGYGDNEAYAIAIQADGKIVAAGRAISGGMGDFAVARYNPDGSLDTTFSADGTLVTDFAGGSDDAYGVAIQPDGKIVVVGGSEINLIYDFSIARYTEEGDLDTTFSFDGKQITDFSGDLDNAIGVAIQADGKIIAAGYTLISGSGQFALARYNSDGSPDNDFGTSGRVLTSIGTNDVILDVELQSDGKIVAAGYATNNEFDFALARYMGDPPPPPPPACLYCDDFGDGILAANWTYVKPVWTEATGNLVGTPSGRKAEAIANPAFTGCTVCTVQAEMSTTGGFGGKSWLLAWHVDKKNTVEVLMKEENDKWVLKQRTGGRVVAKTKALATILPNTVYNVEISFDGTNFSLSIDGVIVATLSAPNQPAGTVGFRVKNTTGMFGSISVN